MLPYLLLRLLRFSVILSRPRPLTPPPLRLSRTAGERPPTRLPLSRLPLLLLFLTTLGKRNEKVQLNLLGRIKGVATTNFQSNCTENNVHLSVDANRSFFRLQNKKKTNSKMGTNILYTFYATYRVFQSREPHPSVKTGEARVTSLVYCPARQTLYQTLRYFQVKGPARETTRLKLSSSLAIGILNHERRATFGQVLGNGTP